ncbi:MAG: hypothetical protein R3E12_01685 [Candidatus Eisenbacteria bacterium]
MQNRPAPTDRRSTRAGALTLPPDLLRKVRFRISVAALLFTIGFAVDPAIPGVSALASKISGQAVGIPVNPPFLVLNLCAITCSVVLWFLTRADRLRQSTLLGACPYTRS